MLLIKTNKLPLSQTGNKVMLLIKTNKLPLSQAAIIPFNSTFYNMNALPLAKKAKLSLTISMVSVISKASASITATHNTQHTLLQPQLCPSPTGIT